MKREKIVFFCLMLCIVLLFAIFGKYLYYLNEPMFLSEVKKSDMECVGRELENDAYNDGNVYLIKVKNTLLNNFFRIILNGETVYSDKYSNNYIAIVNEKDNSIEHISKWDEKKYGILQQAVISQSGDIYALGLVKSMDMSVISEENIVVFGKGNNFGKTIYSVKHKDSVSDLDKAIYGMSATTDGATWLEKENDYITVKKCNSSNVFTHQSVKSKDKGLENMIQAAIYEDCFYASTSDNEFIRVDKEGNSSIVQDYSSDRLSLYRLYKYDDSNVMLHLLDSYEEKLKLYSYAGGFDEIDLNGETVDKYLANKYQNNSEYVGYKVSAIKYITYTAYVLILILFIYGVRYFYINILKRRVYITFKLILTIVPILIVGTYAIAIFSAEGSYKNIEQELFNGKMFTFNSYIESKLNKVKNVYGRKEYLGDLFSKVELYSENNAEIIDEINVIMDYSFVKGKFDTEGWYWTADVVKNGCMYKIIDTDKNDPMYMSRYSTGRSQISEEVIKGTAYTTYDYNDEYIFELYPIKDSSGKVSGMIQIGTYYYGYKNKIHDAMFSESMKRIVTMSVILLTVMVFITVKSLFPITKLTRKIETAKVGELEEIGIYKGNDEVRILTDSFNSLVRSINENMKNMELLNSAYYRFVPLEFISLLEKKDIKEVALGDSINKDMAIMCIGIRNFYEVMQNVDAERVFGLLSEVLEFTGPIIRKYGGVVDRYTDRGLIAMFPQQSQNALRASIEIIKHQDENMSAKISCAINRGPVTFGIIGEERRLQNGAISHTTDCAMAMLENATELSSNIVITQSVLDSLDEPCKLHIRRLGIVKFSTVKEPIGLYDVYEADNINFLNIKNITGEIFEEAVAYFENKDFVKARQGFVKVLDISIDENVARNYFYQSDRKVNDASDRETYLEL